MKKSAAQETRKRQSDKSKHRREQEIASATRAALGLRDTEGSLEYLCVVFRGDIAKTQALRGALEGGVLCIENEKAFTKNKCLVPVAHFLKRESTEAITVLC